MGRFSKILLLGMVFALAFVVAQPATAQISTGSISGAVVDQTGASVPGASVTLTNRGTGAQTTLTTPENGSFRFGLLPVGIYDLEIKKQGFKKLKLTSVAVNANVEHGISNVVLELGAATTTVEVSAAPPLIETAQAQITTTFSSQQVTMFPGVNENEGLDFLALQIPGAANTRDLAFTNTNGVGFSLNGIRGRNNDQQIDGQNNNDNSVAGPGVFLSNVDFINEYQITTNNFGPEYGRNSGSVVNEVTKGGTNNWHGAITGTETNSVLTSLNNSQKFLGQSKPARFNDEFTSATIGGPVWKNHVFLFGGFDDEIHSSNSEFQSGAFTPTPAGLATLAGCYPGSNTIAALQAFGPYGIGAGNPQPLPVSITNLTLTAPAAPGGTCSVQFSQVQRLLGTSVHEYDWTYRMDVHVTDSDSFFGRYIFNKLLFLNSANSDDGARGYPINVPSLGQAFLSDWTHTFSSRTLNEFRVSFSRLNVLFGGNSLGNSVPPTSKLSSGLAAITIGTTGGKSILAIGPANNLPQGRIVNTWQLQDNFNHTLGRHQLKAGVNFTYQRSPNTFLPFLNGGYSFSSFSNFARNRPSSINIADGTPTLDFREYDTFLYAGDDWKIRDNLTLNLGLTWSGYGQPVNLFHSLDVKTQTGPTPFWNPSLPLSVTTVPSIPTPKTSFGPSIGFAYSPHWGGFLTGNGKTVIRGGYRLNYDPPYYNIYLNISTSAPNLLRNTLSGAAALANPMPAVPSGPNVRAALASSLTLGVFDPRTFARTTITPNFGPDKVHSWSFGVQRELVKHAVFEARYVGNHALNLFQSINENPLLTGYPASLLPTGVVPCPAASALFARAVGRQHCDSYLVRERTNTGYSDYNGLQTELRATNLFNQLTLKTAYTWSKTTDNATEIFGTGAAGATVAFAQNPLDIGKGEHGLSGIDFPNTWTATFLEDIPFMRAQHGVIGHILGGWAVSGNYIIQSGQTYTAQQFALNISAGGSIDDVAFNNGFIGTFDTVRPFVGSASANPQQVGIFAGDVCNLTTGPIGPGQDPSCALAPSALLSFNAFNSTGAETAVSKKQVRIIVNGATADTIFGTPFGNVARNTYRDFHTNTGNFSLYKNIKFGERATLQWHMTMLNVFNHPNFASIDAFVDDAGVFSNGSGFAAPNVQPGGLFGGNGPGRQILFGLKVIF